MPTEDTPAEPATPAGNLPIDELYRQMDEAITQGRRLSLDQIDRAWLDEANSVTSSHWEDLRAYYLDAPLLSYYEAAIARPPTYVVSPSGRTIATAPLAIRPQNVIRVSIDDYSTTPTEPTMQLDTTVPTEDTTHSLGITSSRGFCDTSMTPAEVRDYAKANNLPFPRFLASDNPAYDYRSQISGILVGENYACRAYATLHPLPSYGSTGERSTVYRITDVSEDGGYVHRTTANYHPGSWSRTLNERAGFDIGMTPEERTLAHKQYLRGLGTSVALNDKYPALGSMVHVRFQTSSPSNPHPDQTVKHGRNQGNRFYSAAALDYGRKRLGAMVRAMIKSLDEGSSISDAIEAGEEAGREFLLSTTPPNYDSFPGRPSPRAHLYMGDLLEELGTHGYGLIPRQETRYEVVGVINQHASTGELCLASCGHVVEDAVVHSTADGDVCDDCFDEYYRHCVETDEYHHRDRLYYWDSDQEFHLNAEDEDDGGDDGDPDNLMDYGANALNYVSKDSSFTTRPDGDFHMGIELETVLADGSGSTRRKIQDVREELGSDYLIAKYDGSLSSSRISGQGIEWVTRPTSLSTHIDKLGNWGESSKGLVAWNAGCCGMHIHIDSKAFTPTSLGKMLQFFNKEDNVEFIRAIAGRHPDRDNQAREYAGRDCDVSDTVSPIKALKGKDSGRYTMVNLCNLGYAEARRLKVPSPGGRYNTVEVRIFRASMRRERLISQIEFTHALVLFCRASSYRKLTGEAFKEWLADRVGQYPTLAKFLSVQPNKHGTYRKDAAEAREVETV